MDITKFYKEVEAGNLDMQRKGSLVLFDYNRTCAFSRTWNEITLMSRGLVMDDFGDGRGLIVANPPPKFFNYEEPEFQEILKTIPSDEPFIATKKEDGSEGIVYNYRGEWEANTRGSFASDQAIWAKKWLDVNVNKGEMYPEYTYVFEIVYPKNRIVVDYGGKEALILITARHTTTGKELDRFLLKCNAREMGVEVVEEYSYTSLEQLVEARGKLTSNEEGFVIYYPRLDIRFKLKGEEYCKLHKKISNMTPLSFWRACDYENTMEVPLEYVIGLPEEFRNTSELLKFHIERLHKEYFLKIQTMAESCPKEFESKFARYTYMMETFGDLGSMVLSFVEGKLWRVRKFIHDDVRPTANIIPGVDLSRVDRVINNDG